MSELERKFIEFNKRFDVGEFLVLLLVMLFFLIVIVFGYIQVKYML